MTRIHLMVITNGRGPLMLQTIDSAEKNLIGPIASRTIIDDSQKPAYADWLERMFPNFLQYHAPISRGFAGAIQSGWARIPGDADCVLHLEDDFTFTEPVDLEAMAAVLGRHPHLAQLVLKRQPVNDLEAAAGGVIECWPDEYVDKTDYATGVTWCEHRLFFSTNPSLYRRSLTEVGWPDAPASEAKFTQLLLQDPDARFAFWGAKTDPPKVTHIGSHRTGTGY